jgi:hypothetical protein
MSEQFHLEFGEVAAAEEAERALKAIRMDGRPLIGVQRDGARVFAGCDVYTDIAADARLRAQENTIPFFDVFYRIPTTKSGMHHPDGMLWIRLPDRLYGEGGRVPLTSVAPTLLSLFQVEPGAHMKGASLSLDETDRLPLRKSA